jgi:hypothetical protein
MAILYLLHNLFPSAEYSEITEGQRNSRIFLMGMFIYTLIYIMLKNCELNGTISEFIYPTYKVGFYIMFIADVAVMAWTYKNYFGRSVVHEVNEIVSDKTKSNFDYDEKRHKYIQKEQSNNQKDESGKLEKVLVKINPKNDVDEIKDNKVEETEKTTDRKLSDTKKTPSPEKTSKSSESSESSKSSKSSESSKSSTTNKTKSSIVSSNAKKSAITLE